jgi:hypothetical protein
MSEETKAPAATESITESSTAVTTEIAIKNDTSVVLASAGSMSMDEMLGEDQGAGMDNITAEFMQIPFLRILQALSPQCTKGKPEFDSDARPGMIVNTMTGRMYKAAKDEDGEGILVCASHFGAKYIEWKNRDAGGGIAKVWGEDTSFEKSPEYKFNDKTRRFESLDGSSSIQLHLETFVTTLGTPDAPEMGSAVISMSGTQLKRAKGWNSARMSRRIARSNGSMITPPSWYGVFRLRAQLESNDQGTWYGWDIQPYSDLNSFPNGVEIYTQCKKFLEGIQGNKYVVDDETREGSATGDLSSAEVAGDIPF